MKRFLCSREGTFRLSDGGFLSDPEMKYGHILNPDVVTFESILDAKCLIILGEPGIGKSTEMKRLIES